MDMNAETKLRSGVKLESRDFAWQSICIYGEFRDDRDAAYLELANVIFKLQLSLVSPRAECRKHSLECAEV